MGKTDRNEPGPTGSVGEAKADSEDRLGSQSGRGMPGRGGRSTGFGPGIIAIGQVLGTN